MREQLINFVKEEYGLGSKHYTLLAVSGGIDSMAMAWLFAKSDLRFCLAHCNFQLRGASSDADEALVRSYANHLEVSFHSKRFDTKAIAEAEKESVQLVARRLRYTWLEETRKTHGYDFIATGHHFNDSLETVFYNFTKGTGIRGLLGIPGQNGVIIRPMLFTTREKIFELVEKENIPYREDESNLSDKYARNKIRHHIIPILREINPKLETTARTNLQILKETEEIFNWAIQKIKEECVQTVDKEIHILTRDFGQYPAPKTVLFELLAPFQFNSHQIQQIMSDLHHPGRQFFSPTHRLFVDREKLIVVTAAKRFPVVHKIGKDVEQIELENGWISLKLIKGVPRQFPRKKNIALLNPAKLKFPLTIRHWNEGDSFQPFGMKEQHQKISDFFINQKFSMTEKEQVWLLESDGQICWVVDHRIDERFKVLPANDSYWKLEFKPKK